MFGQYSKRIEIAPVKKVLYEIKWKSVLKDFLKFYIYLVIFYSLAFLLLWGHAYIALESSKIDLNDVLSNPVPETSAKEFKLETYEWLAKQMNIYMFGLVCFGVFFSVPPKKLRHIAIVTVLLSLTVSPPFFYDEFLTWAYDFGRLSGYVLFAWVCSLIWFRFSEIRALRKKS